MAAGTMTMGGIRCPVCFAAMAAGQAIFTAECSHTFHLRCVPGGAAVCPVCAAPWRDAPSPPTTSSIPAAYDDDDPVEPVAPAARNSSGGGGGVLVLKTHCEYPALSRGAARDGFAVLVHAKAPAAAGRAPLDLVTVLDVSTSMTGDKLALVKRAMGFVIDSLGAADRLSVVAFATDARGCSA
uniref:RING-type domain-containing protein n=1 Tax=Oryza glumipatula TaxID=40148 RepID=A0A0E0BQ61_9ORYZ